LPSQELIFLRVENIWDRNIFIKKEFMIEVNIDVEGIKMTYNVPDSWDEVTVEQFANLYRHKNPNNNELLGAVNIISALSGIDSGVLLQMDIDDFKELATRVTFITSDVPRTDVDYIEIGEDKYYLYSDFNKLTTGEVITLETLMGSVEYDIHKIIPDLLCLFLRKKDSEGKYEKFTTEMLKRKELFLSLKITQIYHIFNFFFLGESSSQNSMKDSTKNNDQSTTLKEDLQKN
jgi:hypothetical protein